MVTVKSIQFSESSRNLARRQRQNGLTLHTFQISSQLSHSGNPDLGAKFEMLQRSLVRMALPYWMKCCATTPSYVFQCGERFPIHILLRLHHVMEQSQLQIWWNELDMLTVDGFQKVNDNCKEEQ